MTTKRNTREWFGGALEQLVSLCRTMLDDEKLDDATSDVRDLMREIALVEKVTGRSVTEALPRKRSKP